MGSDFRSEIRKAFEREADSHPVPGGLRPATIQFAVRQGRNMNAHTAQRQLLSFSAVAVTILVLAAFLLIRYGHLPSTRSQSSGPGPTPTASPALSRGPSSLIGLHMVDSASGWALVVPSGTTTPFGGSGAMVVRTQDGGKHWHLISDLAPVATDFHDGSHAWIADLQGAYSTASHEAVTIDSTVDSGVTWRKSPMLTVDGVVTHIQFVDAMHGWIFATPSAGGVVGAGDTTLYRTVDGGNHWQAVKPASQVRGADNVLGGLPEACPGSGPIGPPAFVAFVDIQNGWLGALCDRIFLYVTHDGGLTWSPEPVPSFPGAAPSHPDSAHLQYLVDPALFLSANDIAIFIHRGSTTGANSLQDAALYESHDKGRTWSASRLPVAEISASFADPQHGWMVTAGQGGNSESRSLYRTADGGRTWTLVSGPSDFLFRDLVFVSSKVGFVVDSQGGLFETSDGGVTWAPVHSAVS